MTNSSVSSTVKISDSLNDRRISTDIVLWVPGFQVPIMALGNKTNELFPAKAIAGRNGLLPPRNTQIQLPKTQSI